MWCFRSCILSPTPELGAARAHPPRSALAAALVGQTGAGGTSVVLLQLLLILLWHTVLILGPAALKEGLDSAILPADLAGLFAMILASVVGGEGILAYIPYRIITRRKRFSLVDFTRLWWQTCLWGLLAFPLGAALVRHDIFDIWAIFLAAYLLAGPGWLADRERRSRLRRAHWQPVCPECGYSLRRLTSDRCPECGEPFPTPSCVYRRWANRRLPWERKARGSTFFAYLRTVLLIIFRPGRAARGVAIPDRYGRAVRWAIFHLVVLGLLGTVCVSQPYFRDFVLTRLTNPNWSSFATLKLSGGDLLGWSTQSLLIWVAALGSLPLVGVALAIAMPGRHPAARRAMAKWSLYSFAGVSVGLGLVILLSVVPTLVIVLASTGAIRINRARWYGFVGNSLPFHWLTVWALLYGCWWAMGSAANPYLRRRGWAVFLGHALTYIAVWLVLAKVLFDPGELQALL
jgi:hypothetical protein